VAAVKRLDQYWQTRNPLAWALLPLSALFCLLAGLRAMAYRIGWLRVRRLGVPLIVVGNITVGGTGKTPLVVWLARRAAAAGFKPGIVTRGYRGAARQWPQVVRADSDPHWVGDEPVLLARRAHCPVIAGPGRVAAGARLRDEFGCDLLISDDGLQHYALGRDVEIAVMDGRRFGNGFCLPAGPLRERVGRLRRVDWVVVNGTPRRGEIGLRLTGDVAVCLADPAISRPLAAFVGEKVTAVAGIGNPSRFFSLLRAAGLEVREQAFADHHRFVAEDLAKLGDALVMMTEKDAVKCAAFGRANHWYLPVCAEPDESFVNQFDKLLKGLE
jgi:tetraacyldisaccharide 4'-kinase